MNNFDFNNEHDIQRHNLVRVGEFIQLGRSNNYEIYSEKTGIINTLSFSIQKKILNLFL
jgi:hypothetical protein